MCVHLYSGAYRADLAKRKTVSHLFLRNFIRVAKAAWSHGERIAFERPRHASGWKYLN